MSDAPAARLPLRTATAMVGRMLAIQGAWNYETMVGNGIGFCMEPALRRLPGGVGGDAYRAALARQAQYFNAHPYLAAVAVGALARAELDGVEPTRIERFRTALCGPLGSVGDRLVWAAWLPLCAAGALLACGLGTGPRATVLLFLGTYNAGHVALRAWGLAVGWRHGLRVASALGAPALRHGPDLLARAGAVVAGVAIPLALGRLVAPREGVPWPLVAGVLVGGGLALRLRGRFDAWRWSLAFLIPVALYSVLR